MPTNTSNLHTCKCWHWRPNSQNHSFITESGQTSESNPIFRNTPHPGTWRELKSFWAIQDQKCDNDFSEFMNFLIIREETRAVLSVMWCRHHLDSLQKQDCVSVCELNFVFALSFCCVVLLLEGGRDVKDLGKKWSSNISLRLLNFCIITFTSLAEYLFFSSFCRFEYYIYTITVNL